MSEDLFIRRVYTYKGISVAVDIDLIKKEVSLVSKNGDNSFSDKNWYFTHRTREYLGGWIKILNAMEYAIKEADKVLLEAEKRDDVKFTELLLHLNDILESKKGNK